MAVESPCAPASDANLANRLTDTGADFPYPLSPLSPIPLHRLQRFYIGAGVAWY